MTRNKGLFRAIKAISIAESKLVRMLGGTPNTFLMQFIKHGLSWQSKSRRLRFSLSDKTPLLNHYSIEECARDHTPIHHIVAAGGRWCCRLTFTPRSDPPGSNECRHLSARSFSWPCQDGRQQPKAGCHHY
jgi:hypothetical protein